jgi:hypothetical protein
MLFEADVGSSPMDSLLEMLRYLSTVQVPYPLRLPLVFLSLPHWSIYRSEDIVSPSVADSHSFFADLYPDKNLDADLDP